MKLKYIGEGDNTSYGITFPHGVAVEFPDDAVAGTTRVRIKGVVTVTTLLVKDKLTDPRFWEECASGDTVERDILREICDIKGIQYSPLAGVKALQKKIDEFKDED